MQETNVYYQNKDDARLFGKKGRKGMSVPTRAHIPFLVEEILKNRTIFEEAKNHHNIFPTVTSKRKLKEFQSALLEMKKKGRQITIDKDRSHILMARVKKPPRFLNPLTYQSLYNQLYETLQVAKTKRVCTTIR